MNKVISGGQTGVDRLGLEIAKEFCIPTGGMAAKGFRTENGPDYTLKEFGLIESDQLGYPARTAYNVFNSDGTALFGNMRSPGSMATIRYCKSYGKPFLTNPVDAEELIEWIKRNGIVILNVAGNRASKLSEDKILLIEGVLSETFKIFSKCKKEVL